MELSDFPAELLHEILFHAVVARDVKRGLRLRLVCTLFETHLLDDFCSPGFSHCGVGDHWYIKNQYNAERVWHSYLVYRVKNETESSIGRFVEIRQIAHLIKEESEHEVNSIIDVLCWLALEQQGNSPAKHGFTKYVKRNPKGSLLSAATYFNLVPLVYKLLAEGCCSTDHDYLFPPAMEVAACEGNTQILKILQEHLPEYKETEGPGCKWSPWEWQGKVCPDSIIGATIRGDLDILKLALYPPSRATPDNTNILGQSCAKIPIVSCLGRRLRRVARKETRSIEVYEYIDSLFEKPPPNEDYFRTLVLHAELGNLSMVRHILDRGVSVNAASEQGGEWRTALIAACEACHEDIVDLLLERGADPNVGAEESRWNTALPMAASSGSLTIVRKLVSHGARVNETVDFSSSNRRPAIWWAVVVEHIAMFQFLLENGASLDGHIGSTALEMASELGMMSMAEILRNHGVTIVEPVVDSARSPWKKWAS